MTSTAATRFDLDNLNTAATRALAEAEPALRQAMAERAQEARDGANAMTIAELKEQVGDRNHLKASAPKAEWVEAYVSKEIDACAASKMLREVGTEAAMDRMLAHRLNDLLNQSDDADAKLREVVANNDGFGMTVALCWKMDNAFAAQAAAVWARDVLAGYAEGHELREVALHFLQQAVRKALGFPSFVRSNGLSGGHRMQEMVEAIGANAFRDAVTSFLNVETTINIWAVS